MQKMTGNIPTMTPRIICVLFFMAMAVMQASGQLREVPPSRHGQPEQRFMEEWKRNPPRPLQTADTAVLVFIGDVMLHTRQMENSHERYLRKGGSAPASDHEAYDFSPYLEDIRDSIMAANLPGESPGSHMTTETEAPIFCAETHTANGTASTMLRGLWKMEGGAMGGPFVCRAVADSAKGRTVVAEGFAYAPGKPKRSMMKQLEAALLTLRLN